MRSISRVETMSEFWAEIEIVKKIRERETRNARFIM
jgi:hypothetical protein